jgi:squalene-hopene/tetraprenyl-beta-curcumene cyclase
MKVRIGLLIGALALAFVATPAVAGPRIDPAQATKAKKSVDQGLHFLRYKQETNGSYGNHVGLTAMVVLAFAESHRAYTDGDGPFVSKAATWLVAQARGDGAITGDATPTYNTALAIMALHALDKVKFKAQIEAGQKFLVKFQSDEDQKYAKTDKFYGGIGYGGDERPDLSNLQYAIEALKDTDYDPKSDVWAKAQMFVSRCQNRSESNDQAWAANDGGFIYAPGQSSAGETNSYGAMSFAGLKSLLFTQASKDDPRVKAVWGWISKNYDFNQHPGMGTTSYYYYLQTAAAGLEAFGEQFVPDERGRKRDWAVDLLTKLLSLQVADGSWKNDNPRYWESNPVLATARAVTSINHVLRATGVHK